MNEKYGRECSEGIGCAKTAEEQCVCYYAGKKKGREKELLECFEHKEEHNRQVKYLVDQAFQAGEKKGRDDALGEERITLGKNVKVVRPPLIGYINLGRCQAFDECIEIINNDLPSESYLRGSHGMRFKWGVKLIQKLKEKRSLK